jgi:biopolymer transport protein ExbD
MEFTRSSNRTRRIPQLITLINVIFLLLSFFLIAGRFETYDPVDVVLPQAQSSALVQPGEIMVSLAMNDVLTINYEPVAPEAFEAAIADMIRQQPGAAVSIKADARLDATRMIQAMQAIKRAGAVNISITTKGQNGQDVMTPANMPTLVEGAQ